jgi:hypothetical protein
MVDVLSYSYSASRFAAWSSLVSWPDSAVSCNPNGNPSETCMGIEMAGVPKAVQGAFILGSPVEARPSGAGPVAAGVRITGVVLNMLEICRLLCSMKLNASR